MPLFDNYLDNDGQSGADEFIRESSFDKGLMRPFVDRKNRACVTINVGHKYDPKEGKDMPG